MGMTEQDRVFDAFRNCITEPKCKDCPWTECDKLKNRRVEIPIDLALAVMRRLKAQEIGKVNITISQSDGWKEGNCPFCGMKVDSFYNWSFCGTCGRAVKWE